ncbi:MAG TPA: SMI1/KNR4 family protein [Allosphingosinicella sp.]
MHAPDFSDIFLAWLVFLASLGFRADSHLHPPATLEAIAAVEQEIGFALPDDLRGLYLKADGQKDPFEIRDPSPGTLVMPFFGGYDFVPLERALSEYRNWMEVYEEGGAGSDASFHDMVTVRSGDPVHREYWRPGWFPFAVDGGGNAYAVDLSPAPGGQYGQVILIGSDEDERRVLAPSLGAFLLKASRLQNPRIERAPPEDHSPWASFDAETGR